MTAVLYVWLDKINKYSYSYSYSYPAELVITVIWFVCSRSLKILDQFGLVCFNPGEIWTIPFFVSFSFLYRNFRN